MGIQRPRSLRKAINAKCRSCIHDELAAGTWRQQVTLCPVKNCALYPVRPLTEAPIPERVLDYYLVEGPERAFYRLSRPPEGPLSEHSVSEECPSKGCLFAGMTKAPNRGSSR